MTWRNRGRHWLEQYARNVLYTVDLAVNVVFLFGDPKETLSSRMAKRARDGRSLSRLGCRFLDVLDAGHCINSLRPDRGANQVWQSPWKSIVAGLTVLALLTVAYVHFC